MVSRLMHEKTTKDFKDAHSGEFGWYDEMGSDSKMYWNDSERRLEFKDSNGDIWDVKNNKMITSELAIKSKGPHVPGSQKLSIFQSKAVQGITAAQAKTQADIKNKYNEIASRGGNSVQEADTPEEMISFLSAINNGQNQFASLSTVQQGNMLQRLDELVTRVSQGTMAQMTQMAELIDQTKAKHIVGGN